MRGEGNIGTGAQGGGFVQGQSRTGTGLSGVDPLAQILGSAAEGINAFLSADQTIMKARDAQGNLEIDAIERKIAKLQDSDMDKDEVAKESLKLMNDYRKTRGRLPSRGTAGKRFDKARSAALQSVRNFSYEDEQQRLTAALRNANGVDVEEIKIIEEWRADMEPYDAQRAIRDTEALYDNAVKRRINRETDQVIIEAHQKFQSRLEKDGFFTRTTDAEGRSIRTYNPLQILQFASDNGFDIDDDNVMQEMTEAFLRYHQDDFTGLTSIQAQKLAQSWAGQFMQQAGQMVEAAQGRLRSFEIQEATAEAAANWQSFLQNESVQLDSNDPLQAMNQAFGLSGFSPTEKEARREDAMAKFAVRVGTWKKENTGINSLTPDRVADSVTNLLVADSLEAAKQAANRGEHASSIDMLLAARDAVPMTAQEAQDAGWLGNVAAIGTDLEANMTDEQWSVKREAIMEKIRAQQLKASKPAFAAAVSANSMNATGLDNMMSQLWLLAGPDETRDLDFDKMGRLMPGTDFIVPLMYGEDATPFQSIFDDIATARNKLLGGGPELSKQRVWLDKISSGPVVSTQAAREASGLQTNPSEQQIQGLLGGALSYSIGDFDSWEHVQRYLIEQKDNLSPEQQAVASYIADMNLSGRSFKDDPAAQGTLWGMIARGWAEGAGTKLTGTASDKLSVVIPEAALNFTGNVFAGLQPGQPVSDPADAMGISAMWDSLMVPDNPNLTRQLRLEAFGTENFSAARTTALMVEKNGGRWDPKQHTYLKDDGTPFDGLQFIQPRAIKRMSSGQQQLANALIDTSTPDPAEYVSSVINGFMNPMSIMAEDGGDAYSMSRLKSTLDGMGSDFRGTVAEAIGFQGNPDDVQINLSVPQRANVEAQVYLDTLEAVSSGKVDPTKPESIAQFVASATKQHVLQEFDSMTIVGGQLVKDKSGVVGTLVEATKSNDPATLFSHVGMTSLEGLVEATGRTNVDDADKAEVYGAMFYESLDMPGDTDYDPSKLVDTALSIYPNKSIDTLTVSDMMMAHFTLERGGDTKTPFNAEGLKGAQIDIQDGRMEFAFPQFTRDGRNMTGVAINMPKHVLPGSTFVWPVRKVVQGGRTAAPSTSLQRNIASSPAFGIQAANAQQQQDAAARTIAKYDTNGDGKLTGAERDAMIRDRNNARRGG